MGTDTDSITDYLQTLRDIEIAIRFGVIPDEVGTLYHKFGGRLEVDTTQRILSTCLNENPFNVTNQQLYISSSSISDTQQIVLEGVNQQFTPSNTSITLNGQTAIPIPFNISNYRTIYRGFNIDNLDIQGQIYIGTESTPNNGVPAEQNTYAVINGTLNGKLINQTLTSIFTVPVGYTAFIYRINPTPGKAADKVDYTLYKRSFGKVWRYNSRFTTEGGTIPIDLPYLKFEEKSDIKIMCATLSAKSTASITYDIIVLQNTYLNKFRRLAWR